MLEYARQVAKSRFVTMKTSFFPIDRAEPMWIDTPAAKKRADKYEAAPQVRKALLDLIDDGLAVIPGNLSDHQTSGLVAAFDRYCASDPLHLEYRDEHGLHDRLANLHLASDEAKTIALNPIVMAVLDAAFECPADVVGSLFFERGSGQDLHRDTPSFFTVPLNRYFGVWHALEDIHPDSGALTYFVGGHRAIRDATLIGMPHESMESYFSAVEADCLHRGLKKSEFYAKKGDTLIWHPELPHGGSPIRDPRKSRRSIVFHYKAKGCPMYGPRDFFGDHANVSAEDRHQYVSIGEGRRAIDHGGPRWFVNKKEGNFKEF